MKGRVSLYILLFVHEVVASTSSPKDDCSFCSFTFCPPVVPSVPGVPGVPGTHGTPGPPGPAGPKGIKGDDGTRIERSQGDPGPIGLKGEKGEDGRDGQDGQKGHKGAPGQPGQTAPTVAKESKGYGTPGPPGEKGDKGEAGTPPLTSKLMGNTSGSTCPKVAFTATRTSSFRGNAGDAILFPSNDVITNVGAAFDGDTGIFTSKFNGVHVFMFSLYRITAIKDIAVSLVHDSRVIVTATSGALNGETDQVTSGAVLELEVGDQVWLEVVNDGTTISSDDKRFTSFTGFML